MTGRALTLTREVHAALVAARRVGAHYGLDPADVRAAAGAF